MDRDEIEQRDRRIAEQQARIQALEKGIKEERDQLDLAMACNDKARELLRCAQTQAGRAGFAAAVLGCPRAEEHAKTTHILIAEAIKVLDMAA